MTTPTTKTAPARNALTAKTISADVRDALQGLVEMGLITCRIAGGKRHLRLRGGRWSPVKGWAVDRPQYVPGLAARVLRQIEEHPETWDQDMFESHDGRTRCAAGWAIALVYGGVYSRAANTAKGQTGPTSYLARVLLGTPSGSVPFAPEDDPRPWLRRLAARDEYMRTRSGGMGRGFCSALKGVARG